MNSERTALSGFAFRILSWFCPEHLYEEIEGDLVQRFERDAKVFGKRKAEGKLLWSVIKFFRPGILLRNRFLMRFNQSYMFSSYLKIMRRNLVRHKFHSAINVIGLTVGITFALLIGVFIRGELQVNKSLKEVDRLYLLENKYTGSADNFAFFSPAALSTEAMEEYPAVFENYYRFWDRNVTVSKDDKHFRIQTMIGDSTFARMFGFPVLFGDVTSALSDPYSLVISEKIARQFFNRADVIGESLVLHAELGGLREFIVKAVIADPEEKNSVSDFMNSDAQMFISA
ncbi:MAG: permease prefix domain 2-containing transporter [Bacteroidota bacterium]